MASPGDSFLIAAVTFCVAAGAGYGMFRLVSPKGRAETPMQMGRKWFAWVTLGVTITNAPKFLLTFEIDSFLIWVIQLLLLGGPAFIGGWIYGKFFGPKTLVTEPAVESPAETFTEPNYAREGSTLPAVSPSSSEDRLEKLNDLLRKGLVTQDEFDRQRKRILETL